ncbi:hypothetical protein MMYC01_203908 [Madurella mycetomatis]|uniref:Uncharacterized protein n=1 Tax=Madurella mycetomatis TaxID=100816 RepID=A0A175WBM7_9PEZI|nr:hypothetical protein MMYC01_203908 [Madurella mycetomatis]
MKYLLHFLFLVLTVLGQDVPIILDGALVDATATDDSYNTGGTISLNGWTVEVPKNMLVTFPAAFVPWKDFVTGKDAFLGFEVNVAGNIVNGQSLAAQIIISEFAMEWNQGHIEEINFDGTMKIRNGPTIRINDPNAVFSAGYSFPFMVADDQNPSVTAFSGFPMCVPRSSNDTLCPLSNRPSIPGSTAPQRVFQAPDPLIMAPFLVGDFITYRGFRLGNEIICYEIVAWNVQITTSGVPTYVRVEESLVGVYTASPIGEVAETRFVGYVSDPSVTVSITAIDINPCTGRTTDRSIGVGQNRPEEGGRNKWISRIDGTQTTALTREYRAIVSSGTVRTKNGILAGQYAFPMMEWIQPELIAPGNEPLVNDYSQMTHLTLGIGPDEDGNIMGPLDPFPQSGVTVFDPSSCPPISPDDPLTPSPRIEATIGTVTVSDSAPLFVRSDDTFTLRGFQDNSSPELANDTLTWSWILVESSSAGTESDLSVFTVSTDDESVSVRISSNAPTGEYVFQLSIASPLYSTTGDATFTASFFTGPDTVTVETVTWTSSQSGTLGVTCKSNYLVDSKVGMQVTYVGDDGTMTSNMAPTPPGSGLWSFSSRDVDRPGTITCRSLLGGVGSRTGTTTKRDPHIRADPRRGLNGRWS